MLDYFNKKDQDKVSQEEYKKNMTKNLNEANVHHSAAEKRRIESDQRDYKK